MKKKETSEMISFDGDSKLSDYKMTEDELVAVKYFNCCPDNTINDLKYQILVRRMCSPSNCLLTKNINAVRNITRYSNKYDFVYPFNIILSTYGSLDDVESVENIINNINIIKKRMNDMIMNVHKNQMYVKTLKHRFIDQMTLKMVGEQFEPSKSPERIRQIEARALRIFRSKYNDMQVFFKFSELSQKAKEAIKAYVYERNDKANEIIDAIWERNPITAIRDNVLLQDMLLLNGFNSIAELIIYANSLYYLEKYKQPDINKPIAGKAIVIEDLTLSVRSYNALKRSGHNTVGDILTTIEDGTLMHIRNLGVRSAKEVVNILIGMGFDDDIPYALKERLNK